MTGEVEALALYAGQSVGLVSSLRPAGDIVRGIAEEAIQTLERCQQLLAKDTAP
jgi:nitronate monooxygenase